MLTAVSIAEYDINLTYNNRSMFILSCLPVCLSLFFSLVCLTVRCPGCLGYCRSTLSNILRKVPIYFRPTFQTMEPVALCHLYLTGGSTFSYSRYSVHVPDCRRYQSRSFNIIRWSLSIRNSLMLSSSFSHYVLIWTYVTDLMSSDWLALYVSAFILTKAW